MNCIGCAPTSSSLIPPSMPISTRKTNVDAHPSRIVLDSQSTRRTKRQIEDDRNRAEEAAIVEREETEANRRSVIATIAEIEDAIQENKEQLLVNTTRPDLRPSRAPPNNMMSGGPAGRKE
jgi:hypothetical protein